MQNIPQLTPNVTFIAKKLTKKTTRNSVGTFCNKNLRLKKQYSNNYLNISYC